MPSHSTGLRATQRHPIAEQAASARPKPSRRSSPYFHHPTRHERRDRDPRLQNSCSTQYHTVELGHDVSIQLARSGLALLQRFERSHDLVDLQRAIDSQEHAFELMHQKHPRRVDLLDDLGLSLEHRFRHLGKLDDLERSIALRQQILDCTSENDPDYAWRLSFLADSLHLRYQHLGELHDLRDSNAKYKAGLRLTPEDHPDHTRQLGNLGISHRLLFERLGEIQDLEGAIATHRRAVDLTPEGHPDRPWRLNGLASSLRLRFERLGDIRDLENAISIGRLSVELTPGGHPELPFRLGSLAISLQSRFERLGEMHDLEDAITAGRFAVDFTPKNHPNRSLRLNNLSCILFIRFQRLRELRDIELVIITQQTAVELTPDGHPERPLYLDNLAVHLRTRFEHIGDLCDLQRAITTHQLATDLTPDRHPAKPLRLHNYAISLRTRSNELDADDLERAITTHRLVMGLTPEDDPQNVERLYEFGLSLRMRFERRQSKTSFNAAFSEFMKAATQSLGNPTIRLKAAQQCVSLLSDYNDFGSAELLLSAHSRIIEIFPQLVWLGYGVERRFEESAKLGELINAATHAFVSSHSKFQAIEWMEIGRSLVWSQLYSLRAPLDSLELSYPKLATGLRNISLVLQQSGTASHSAYQALQHTVGGLHLSSSQPSTAFPVQFSSDHSAADHHRTLVIEYESLLTEARQKPGFETFLLPPKLEDLFLSIEALDGPVVFVNVHSVSCDALTLLPNGAVKHVVLSNLKSSHLADMHAIWSKFLQSPDLRTRGTVSADRLLTKDRSSIIGAILKNLWDWIVQPVLQALGFLEKSLPERLPHITWCPTGPLTQLPLHAAGIYDIAREDQPHVFDFVVSSYSPSLSTTLRCRERLSAQDREPNVLVVAQPATPTYAPLPHTRDEGERVGKVFSSRAPTVLMDKEATVKRTLDAMRDYSWLHLACHGFQDAKNPTHSAFALHNGSLTLADLMATTTKDAELAFLSACQTAVGDEKIPEESAHLAAGMLAAGFKGVVATMWSILDQDAPILVQAYYESLLRLREPGSMRTEGYTEAAYALHEAMKVLRDHVGEQNFVRWAPFVHFGV